MFPVFDGHNDTLQRLVAAGGDAATLWREGAGAGHLDLPRARAGGFAGGFFAIWVPPVEGDLGSALDAAMATPPYAASLPAEVPHDLALPDAFAQAATLAALDREGDLALCRSAADIRAAMAAGRVAAIMHMEGAEAIRDLDALHLWHAMGLRSLGPVWSRPTRWANGVPFAFPSSPDTGPGLTPAGCDLVAECNRLRILIDLSHLNAKGVEEVARLSDAPLVATHSCAHAVTPSSRNLTDAQLAAIRGSGGVVGLNFAVTFLREDGLRLPFAGFDPMLRHLDHLLEHLGEDGVALGSDFDGALMPADLPGAEALPRLLEAMAAHGYGEALIERIAWRNWLDVLERTWGG